MCVWGGRCVGERVCTPSIYPPIQFLVCTNGLLMQELLKQRNRMLVSLHARRAGSKETFRRLLIEARQRKDNDPPTETIGEKKPVFTRTSRYLRTAAYATTVQSPPRRTPLKQAVDMVGKLNLNEWLQFLMHAPAPLWEHPVFDGLFDEPPDPKPEDPNERFAYLYHHEHSP